MTEEQKLPKAQIERAIENAESAHQLAVGIEMLKEEDLSTYKISELVEVLKTLKEYKVAAEEAKKAAENMYNALSIGILPERMEDEGIVNLSGADHRVEVRSQLRVSCLKQNRKALHQWFKDHDMEEMVAETVNSSSLKSAVKNAMEDGTPFPAHLLKIEPYKQAVIIKR